MKKVSSLIMASALLAAVAIGAGSAHAALTAVGETHPVYTIPTYYQDATGMALAPCLDQNFFCVLTPAFDPLITNPPLPITATGPIDDTNLPNEIFYFLADAKMTVGGTLGGDIAVLRLALEGSFAATVPNGPIVAPGNGSTFLRINLKKMIGLTPNSTFTVTHPYGTFQFTTDAAGDTVLGQAGQAFRTEDPITGAIPNVFDALLPAQTTQIGPFVIASATPGGPAAPVTDATTGHRYIGNPQVLTAVTGSTTGNNRFQIDGPDIGGVGINTVQTTLFTLAGQIVGLDVAPTGLTDFGVWKMGATSTPVTTFTVTNLTGGAAGPLTVTPPAGFIATGTCAGATLNPVAPGDTCTVDVAFAPVANGSVSGNVTITGTGVPTANIPVTGVGDGIAPTLVLDPVVTFTQLATQTISGSVSDNIAVASVQVSVNGVSQGTATITPGTPVSTWTKVITLSNTTPPGTANIISVTANDTAQPGGNISTAQIATITTDTVNPLVTITSPATGTFVNTRTPALNFGATDVNLAFTTVAIDNAAVNPVPATLGPLADGPHTVRVDAGDSAGNAGTATSSFTVDATPPVITVTSPAPVNGRLGVASPVLRFNVVETNPASTTIKLDGTTVVNPVSGTTTFGPFTAGSSHTLTVDTTDLAGNAATTTVGPFTIVLADGRVTTLGVSPPSIADALAVLRQIVGIAPLTPDQFAHADVSPLDANGVPNPNGAVDLSDALLILRRVVGLVTTF
ncbi:MAG: hypothetical protein JJE30_19285 [Desulfuromonadales bacterium]|nr:hypothetical protein [Desulfuromonadales bacterium]